MIRITCGGVRGSAPIHHPDFLGFGGDTTAFQVASSSGDRVLLDLGTGARALSGAGADGVSRVLLTHFHLDHVIGITQWPPLYSGRGRLEIHAPDHLATTAQEAIGRLFGPPYWPLDMDELRVGISYHSFTADPASTALDLGGLRVRACATQHPGGSTAYRFEDPASGAAAVIATDLEWGTSTAAQRDAFLRLCVDPAPAGLLVMDGQYDPAEMAARAGWGHCSWREAAEIARHAGVRELRITHHDPARGDTALRALEARLLREHPGGRFARQGDLLETPP